MFEDVPEALNRHILQRAPLLSSPTLISLLAAKAVIRFYLGKDFKETDDLLPDRPKVFPSVVPPRYWVRIDQIAGSIFGLRNEPGFEEICRRLSTRELLSVFYEARSAAHFQSYGFSIFARPETQTREADFDFAIGHGSESEINVEATALQETPAFSAATIRNTLSRKRKQLPNDKPAIIICWLPSEWRHVTADFEAKANGLARAFLRGTQRINCLLLAEDIIYRRGNNLGMLPNFLPYLNDRPRHSCPAIDEMLHLGFERSAKIRSSLSLPAPEHGGGSDEFHHWFDWLAERGGWPIRRATAQQ